MKTKTYHKHLFSLVAVSLLIPATASANLLLAGFHDLNGSVNTETADEVVPDFSGEVLKGNVASTNTGGSNDGYYGSSDIPVGSTTGDGYVNLTSTSTLKFEFTNYVEDTSFALVSFLFDAASVAGTTLSISYSVDGGTSVPFTRVVGVNTAGPTPTSTVDYQDYKVDFAGVTLEYLSTLVFTLTSSSDARIDNIGLTGTLVPVPETSSTLALGALFGSSFFIRSRSRRKHSA